ncbi:hypothetical protein [Blautia intestinalis]|uniref:hypothetical protein n=1 Tax=Blautia intestinalis TaxID=2763028 RepID=UPI0022E962A2|nr:hypothetical protein [Blautia intestinalis]
MKLLPDIEIDGHTISLQAPFVIDNYLVTNIRFYCELNEPYIVFKYGNREVVFDIYKLTEKARIALSNYTDSNITTVFYHDDLGHHSFDYQILYDVDLFYHWFYNRLNTDVYEIYRILVLQHRLSSLSNANIYFYVEHNAYKLNGYRKVNTNGDVILNRDLLLSSVRDRYDFNDIARYYSDSILRNTMINNCNKKDYIHEWNYKPEYIKHFMDHENKRTTLLLGAEIEVGGNNPEIDLNKKESVVKKCIQIMNGSDSDKEDLIYSTHDGSVQIELDTMPCSLEYHKSKMNYKEMFKYLDEQGYKGHDCNTAGLHIHANRDYLGKTKLQQELVISKILYIIEKFNDNICIIARRNNDYSKFVGDRAKEDTALILFDKYKREGKKAALNLEHNDTIEFRMFKSTLKYETFILTLEFVKDIIDFAKSVSIEEIEDMNWNNLMQTFSKDLRQYYVNRYNKVFEKMINEDLDKKIEFLKKEIERKKKDIKMKIGGPLGTLSSNRQLSNLQKQLKKCESDKNKVKNKKVLYARSRFHHSVPSINSSISSTNSDNNTVVSILEYYNTLVPF